MDLHQGWRGLNSLGFQFSNFSPKLLERHLAKLWFLERFGQGRQIIFVSKDISERGSPGGSGSCGRDTVVRIGVGRHREIVGVNFRDRIEQMETDPFGSGIEYHPSFWGGYTLNYFLVTVEFV